jgi:hypothetical protein
MGLFWGNFGKKIEKIINISPSELFDLHRIAFEPKSKAITIHKSRGCFFEAPNEGWQKGRKNKKGKIKMQTAPNSLQVPLVSSLLL